MKMHDSRLWQEDEKFLEYGGTENGICQCDSTACSDSVAAMTANSVFIVRAEKTAFSIAQSETQLELK